MSEIVSSDRRAELAAAAYELIAEAGLAGLSMRALARRVGATTGIVTHHFLDRAELVGAALDHARHQMFARAMELGAEASALDLMHATLPVDASMVESWRVWLGVRAAALHDDEMARFHHQMYDEWHAALTDRLDRADAAEFADHVMSVVDGIALRAVLDPNAWPQERQRRHVALAWNDSPERGTA